jgi:hypothetical protein
MRPSGISSLRAGVEPLGMRALTEPASVADQLKRTGCSAVHIHLDLDVPIEDFNALEDAIDRYLAREADRDLAENPDAPTYSMSEVVAAIFEEEPGQGAA